MTTKFEALKWTALRGWGILFRTLFISFVGIAAYLWIDPQPIGDVPFAQLTLNQVFQSLFAFLIASGCIYWFLKFPDQKNTKGSNDNPYISWGWFGILVAMIVFMVSMLFVAWS